MVVDGKEGKQYDTIGCGPLVFSPDGRRFAYTAGAGGKGFVVVDGKEGKPYNDFGVGPIFSPDSRRIAYSSRADNKWFVVADGKEGKQYDKILAGKIVFDAPDRLYYLVVKGLEVYLLEEKIQ